MSDNRELVTIGMSCFNNESTVGRAIQSIIDQTYNNWEILIVDANSSDSTKKIIESYAQKHENIRYIFRDYQSRWVESSLFQLSKARGKFFLFLDADDYISKNYLEILVGTLEKSKAVCAAGVLQLILKNGEVAFKNPSHEMTFKFTSSRFKFVRVIFALLIPESLGLVNILYGVWYTSGLKNIKLWNDSETRNNFDQEFTLNALNLYTIKYSQQTSIFRTLNNEPKVVSKVSKINNLAYRKSRTSGYLVINKFLIQLFKTPPPYKLHMDWIINNISLFSPIYFHILIFRVVLTLPYYFVFKVVGASKILIRNLISFFK